MSVTSQSQAQTKCDVIVSGDDAAFSVAPVMSEASLYCCDVVCIYMRAPAVQRYFSVSEFHTELFEEQPVIVGPMAPCSKGAIP